MNLVALRCRWIRFAGLLQELRYTLHRTWRAPAVAIAVVSTLAIGIGANTAVFTVVKGVLLDPLPYDEPDQLVELSKSGSPGRTPIQ